MMPDKPKIVQCPSCGKQQLRMSLLSGNTFGARFYSDGKRIAPMLPEFPYFVKCPSCGIFFKIKKETLVGETDWDDFANPYVQFMTVDEYVSAIEKGLFNGDEDDLLPLRLALWRALNDSVRDNPHGKIGELPLYEDNCRKILNEIEAKADNDEMYLTCAELWRNIGEFAKCRAALEKIKSTEFKAYVSALNAKCDANNTLTVCVSSN
jgi:predicted RNA-binding Zn-ribbon protein involved in translation (DUF1610 family)